MINDIRKWLSLFISNFFGVFNDNFLKNSIIFVAIGWQLPSWLTQSQLISIASSGLVIPYLLFSPIGGYLAVRYSKLKVFRILKLIEIPIVLLAYIAFYKQWVILAIISVIVIGTQSCLYSPSKYSLIRDIGGEEGVSFGSGLFETMAFLGILLGTLGASVVSDHYSLGLFSLVIVGVAIAGYIATKKIKAVELPEDDVLIDTLNPIKYLKESYLYAKQHRLVNSAVFGSSAFWLISSMMQMNVIIHCKNVYGVSNSLTGVVMASAAVGIALGTSVTGRFSGKKVRKGLIIPALSGMILCLAAIEFFQFGFIGFIIAVTVFAVIAGIFQVPCMAMIQFADLGRQRGSTIAYLNMMNFIFILAGAVLFSLVTSRSGDNSFAVFGAMIVLCLGVLAYFLFRYSDFRRETNIILDKKKG